MLQWGGGEGGGGGVVFQMGGAPFLSVGCPMGGISFGGRGYQKNCKMGGGGRGAPPCQPTVGNPGLILKTLSVLFYVIGKMKVFVRLLGILFS